MKKLAVALIVAPLAFGCAVHPAEDPDPVVVAEYEQLETALQNTAFALDVAKRNYEEDPTPENLGALEAAQQNHDTAVEVFGAWERRYFKEKHGPVVSALATLVGGMHPAGQAGAVGLGALGLNLAAGFMSKRSRKHALKAVKKFAPWKNEDGTPFEPWTAAVDVARALGWAHSNEASKDAADQDETT